MTQKILTFHVATLLAGLLLGSMNLASGAPRGGDTPVPDFTKGGQKDDSHDWTLGPTGARGWMHGARGQTAPSRQILVTTVANGSPANDVLQPGDVILGIDAKPFADDARVQLARAIGAAEAGDGELHLVRWRGGKTAPATIKLPILGAYSDTAPYDCAKSAKIFEQGCRAIATKGLDRVSIPNDLNALALLASGKEEYRPMLAIYARMVADYHAEGFASWFYGYATLFLAEYVAATGDQSVMPGLRRLANEIANGASGVGTWGHKFARPNGNCNGYGAMNSPGIVLATAMVVAREAGVRDPDVDRTIAKSSGFLRWYVNKGAIPYGDHLPWAGHEDNGKCSGAAILFDLLGDRAATEFFTAMSTAAYSERERGHTGNFFNMLWAMPGVSRGGPLATGAYMKEHAWYYDLARGWDGSFAYQGSPPGEEEHGKYTNWDSTGAYLLTYALPRKSLCLTGKIPSVIGAWDRGEVDAVIAAGRDYFSATGRNGAAYEGRTTEELLAGLSSWSPAVRKRSARALAKLEGDFAPALLKLLAGSDRHTRYGAAEALGFLGPRADAAAPQLRALLKQPDPWLQSLACQALPALGPEARLASVPDLLKIAAYDNPDDPRGMVHRSASMALFSPYPGSGGPRAILSDSLDGVDRDLLYPAVRSVLENEDGAARGALNRLYGKLGDQDLVALLPAIIKAIDQLAPSNEMFGDGIRLAGLDLVTRLRIREGMPLCISVIELDRWGGGKRLPKCLDYLGRYGSHAKEVLPQLQDLRRELVRGQRRGRPDPNVALIDQVIAGIKADKPTPAIIDLKDFTGR